MKKMLKVIWSVALILLLIGFISNFDKLEIFNKQTIDEIQYIVLNYKEIIL